MRLLLALAALCALSTASNSNFIQWKAPGATDHRSPCPALNTLANHGYLNRNGQGISRVQLIAGLTGIYNLESNFANTLADSAFELAETDAYGRKVLDLQALRKHNAIEHDASLIRYDFGDVGGDNFSAQRILLNQLKNLSSDGKSLGWKDFAKARNLRQKQEQSSDASFSLTTKQSATAISEATAALRVFGDGNSIPLDYVESFFWSERIPDGWNTPSNSYSMSQVLLDVAKLRTLMAVN